jgi:hypothetical protein
MIVPEIFRLLSRVSGAFFIWCLDREYLIGGRESRLRVWVPGPDGCGGSHEPVGCADSVDAMDGNRGPAPLVG